jgi:dihydrofolate reductase
MSNSVDKIKYLPNQKSEVIMIAAASENNVIGKDNKLIWKLKTDLKRFKSLTSGHVIIMGRKTFESFPKPLPNRKHIVISRQKDYTVPEEVILAHTISQAIALAQGFEKIFIIGGGEIYLQAMPYCDVIELTKVHTQSQGDTHFPEINLNYWTLSKSERHQADGDNEFDFSFLTYLKS